MVFTYTTPSLVSLGKLGFLVFVLVKSILGVLCLKTHQNDKKEDLNFKTKQIKKLYVKYSIIFESQKKFIQFSPESWWVAEKLLFVFCPVVSTVSCKLRQLNRLGLEFQKNL